MRPSQNSVRLSVMGASPGLVAAALDAVSAHVAVVDRDATVVLCNEAWYRFARANGAVGVDWVGWNYLGVCGVAEASGDEQAGAVGRALAEVLEGSVDRHVFDYPCHGPLTERWFILRMTAIVVDGERHAVIEHEDVTPRRLAERWRRTSPDD